LAAKLSRPDLYSPDIARIEGSVFLDGQRLEPSASRWPLKEHSVVRAENGRAEIILLFGDTLFLGENGSVRFRSNRGLNSSRFEILTGSAVVVTGGDGPAVVCEEDVQLSDSGVFRFDVHLAADGERFCRLRVYKGAAFGVGRSTAMTRPLASSGTIYGILVRNRGDAADVTSPTRTQRSESA
jgi:hypothetical protein